MTTITVTDFRRNMRAILDRLTERSDEVVIRRRDGSSFKLTPLEEPEMDETEYLLSTKANRDALARSIGQLERGERVFPKKFNPRGSRFRRTRSNNTTIGTRRTARSRAVSPASSRSAGGTRSRAPVNPRR